MGWAEYTDERGLTVLSGEVNEGIGWPAGAAGEREEYQQRDWLLASASGEGYCKFCFRFGFDTSYIHLLRG